MRNPQFYVSGKRPIRDPLKFKIFIVSTASSPSRMELHVVLWQSKLNYTLNYTWQITVHDTKYNNIKIHTQTQKWTNLYEYYLCREVWRHGTLVSQIVEHTEIYEHLEEIVENLIAEHQFYTIDIYCN